MVSVGLSTIIKGDAREVPLPDSSVDLIVTSPPYYNLRQYKDKGGVNLDLQIGAEQSPGEYLENLLECMEEWIRLLKPTGSIWINIGDKRSKKKNMLALPWRFAISCIDELGLTLRSEVIWRKPNAMPERSSGRVKVVHEHIFHFAADPYKYYSNIDNIREPHKTSRKYMTWEERKSVFGKTRQGEQTGSFGSGMAQNKLGTLPPSVWDINTRPLIIPDHISKVKHKAAFPIDIPQRIISGFCPSNGVVLDPFGGSGTTALVASAMGRKNYTVDLSAEYCNITFWRLQDLGEIRKVQKLISQ